MFPSTPFNNLSTRAKLSLLVLLSAAVLSNLYPITVPLVLLYLPASIFTYLILRLYGITWAAVSAVAAALVVPFSVGHPYAVIWYILELAFVVLFCLQRKQNNLIFSVALYWITLGVPLVAISFYLLGVDLEVGLLISAKNCVNGIANVTLACLLSQLLPLRKWLLDDPKERSFQLSQHLFSMMLGFLMIPAVVMLIGHLQGSIAQMEARISQELASKTLTITRQIELLNAQSPAGTGTNRVEFLERLKTNWSSKDAEQGTWILTLLNYDNILISSSERLKPGSRFNPGQNADLAEVPGGAIHRLPHATRLFMPIAGRWRQSSYLTVSDIEIISGWRLAVEKPVKPFLKELRWSAIRIFFMLTLLTYPALLIASWVSRRIASPLTALSQLTCGLPGKLQEGTVELYWTKSRINEINELNQNTNEMASSLRLTFDEIKAAKLHLEERVEKRTEELHQANEALSESEQRYYSLAEASPIGIFSVNARGRCIYVNQRWCQMVGMNQQQALDSGWARHIHEDDHIKVLSAWDKLVSEQQQFQLEFRIDHPENGILWVFGLATPQLDAQGNTLGIIGTLTDISERIATEQKLRENQQHLNFLAYHDPLTGLANRLMFNNRLEHAMAQAERNDCQIALFFLDLDRFKNINDTFGHNSGDKLLKEISEQLSDCCRQSDTIARLGGDEFMVMMEQVDDISQVSTLANKILLQLARPRELGDPDFYTTASIGISIYPKDGTSVDELLHCADTAMYRAKELGRNNFQFYTADMNTPADKLQAGEAARA